MTSASLKFASELKHEPELSQFIPYGVHLTTHTVSTFDRDYVQVIRLAGASFESADDEHVNNWHERLNVLLRSLASPNLAIWKHLVRREENRYPQRDFPPGFAKELDEKYAARVSDELLMVNELYLTIVYRPQPSKVGKTVLTLFAATDANALTEERAESLEVIEKVASELEASLRRYDPERLGVYQRNGVLYSETKEFIGYLVNGEWQRMPLTRSPMNTTLATSRPFFGRETIELRTPTDTIFGAMLGIKEYPSETMPGFLNSLLTVPFSYVLTQSFAFTAKETAKRSLKTARNRMTNAQDDAKSQIDEIEDALDDLQSNKFVMGEHHFTVFLKAGSLKELADNVSIARSALADGGMVVAREDLALEAAFWAQLPANFKYRPRVASITSRNFAGFSPLHNFPTGRKSGNHWGEALTMLVTAAGTPYYFSYHASDPKDEDGGTKKDIGHALVLGPTGSGKTAFIAFTLAELQAFGVTSVLFTKDRDTEICIRALGGKFYPINVGTPTGWQPMQLDPTPRNIAFLNDLLRKLVHRDDKPLTVTEENEIADAIRAVMRFERPLRRLGRVLDYLDKTKSDGVFVRLQQWCYARKPGEQDGPHAWVFYNPEDTLIGLFGQALTTGFDITEFLDKPTIRTPINMYLFHLTDDLIDGRRFALFIAEFWKSLGDPYFASFAKDQLKTIRKKNGFVVLDSQSPSDAIKHEHSRTLIEQTPTKILFPNPDAKFDDYATDEGLNCSEREYRLLKQEIPEGSRMFLVKQGHNSVVAKLDLKGFDYELSVLSARKHNTDYVVQLIAEYGEEPENWLPHFKAQRRSS